MFVELAVGDRPPLDAVSTDLDLGSRAPPKLVVLHIKGCTISLITVVAKLNSCGTKGDGST